VMASFREYLLAMKLGCTATNRKQTEGTSNGFIAHHQNPRSSICSHLQGRLCRLSFGLNEVYSWSTTCHQGNTDLFNDHLWPAVRSKRRGLLAGGVLLQHDNAWPHTAPATVATIQDLHCECLPHLPHSPDLAPSDYHMFGLLWEVLGRKKFHSDEEVLQVVREWSRRQPQEFSSRGIHILLNGRGTVLNEMETM
jgi:hypothetical protein